MRSCITFLCLVSMIFGSHGNPITNNTEVNEAAEDLALALNTFVNAKGNELMEVVSENVGEIQEEVEGHSEHLQLLESEIQSLAETGSNLGCRGKLHHGYCYFLVNQRYSVHSASLSCERSEGELATFADQACIDAVHDYIIHTDQITDKSTVFVWTNMTTNDDSSVLDTDDNWLPGFPVNSSVENVMWQIMSDDFFLYHDGFLNAPSEATAYPLCRKQVVPDNDVCTDTYGVSICQNDGVCEQTDTSYVCQCTGAWSGDNCELDVDECVLGTHTCNENADCMNNNGSYTCACESGWTGDGYHCEDIDECDLGEDTCDDNAVCENNDGSYTCTCEDMYTGDGHTCEDTCPAEEGYCVTSAGVDQNDGVEKLDGEGGSDAERQSSCLQKCIAHPGATACEVVWNNNEWNGCYAHTQTVAEGNSEENHICWVFSKCSDEDECALSTDSCDDNASCQNTIGSYTCTCNSGYNGDGFTCEDADECALGTDACDDNASCQNTIGSYTCTCNSGYNGDGLTCTSTCGGLAFGGQCYEFQYDIQRNYDQSYQVCTTVAGRHLAHIKSSAIQDAITAYLANVWDQADFYVWLGGYYNPNSHPSRSVQWSDGTWTEIPLSDWSYSYPNSHSSYTRLMIHAKGNPQHSSPGMFNYLPGYASNTYALCEHDL